MVKWCCQKPKAKGRAAVVTRPSPPPPPAAPSGYPPGVAAAGLQAVFNLKITAGAAASPTKRLGLAETPADWSYDAGKLSIAAASAQDGWIIDRSLHLQGAGTYAVTLSACALSLGAVGDYNIRNGKDDGGNAVTLDLVGCKIDASTTASGWGGINSHDNSILNLTNCSCTGAARDYLFTNGGALTDCYFGVIGTNCLAGTHLEHGFLDGGTLTATRCFFDARGGASLGGWTGNLMFGGLNAAGVMTLTDCILAGAPVYGGNYAIQYRTDSHGVTINLIGCVVQKGSSGYIGRGPGASPAVINAVNCRDFDTGEIIDAALVGAGGG
jgi:hypothetical protein